MNRNPSSCKILYLVILPSAFLFCLSPNLTWSKNIRGGNDAQGASMAFTISSPSFQNGAEIPKKFTCDGADVSPELQWTSPPSGTQSFALISDDPDAPAGTWTHWVLFDLSAQASSLPENVSKIDELPTGGRQGRNDFRKIGYGGPCPPAGKPHRYFFKLYALDTKLDLKPGASRQELEQAMQNHILGKAELVGRYQRQSPS
jgi:Raf kinase inhibitor-like YbhB/YbcL family protein